MEGIYKMIKFENITEDLLEHVLEILNSNSNFNIISNGKARRTIQDARNEFLNELTESYLITIEDKYIGLIDFLRNHPKDNYPWLGLLMIHGDYHSRGYGKMSYLEFEEKLKYENFNTIRIGILEKNNKAIKFWTNLEFIMYDSIEMKGNLVRCFEKRLKQKT